MTIRRPLPTVLALGAFLSGACGSHGDPPAAPPTSPPSETTAEATGTVPNEGTPTGAPATPTTARAELGHGTPRVRYALARHVARAELRHEGHLVIDFGAPSSAMYTLGGWRTRVGENTRDGDVTVSVIENVTGHILVPSDSDTPQELILRARAFGDGRLTAYIDQQTIGLARLPSDGSYTTVRIPLDVNRFHRGENSVQLRVPATGQLGSIARAGIAIDWARLGPARAEGEAPTEPPPPPAPSTLTRREGDHDLLTIPAYWSLGYTLDVPRGAVLRTEVTTGRVRVVAHRDGAEPRELGVLGVGTAAQAIDLGALADQLVRLELEASEDTTLRDPVVVTLDGEAAPSRPRIRNVLIYLTDTLRADKLHPYRETTRVRTPSLDQWVEHATVMFRGHSQENWTKPSVTTLLSGLFPWEHQATTEEAIVSPSVDLLSERLGREGFVSAAFIANGFCSDRFGFRQGWSSFRNYIREGMRSQGQFVAADVIEWLDARDAARPFFLYVHTIDPHVPYLPPAAELALYDPDPYEGPIDFNRDRELLEKIKAGTQATNERDRVHLEALYDAEITYHDHHFGSIMEALERRGLADDTMVVFTADHGEEFFDHGSVGHGHSMYEELVNVPLIVRVPGVTDRPVRLDDSVGLVDVLPTIYEVLGRDVPADLSGESFYPLLRGESADAPRIAVSGFMEGWRSVNIGRFKFIQRAERQLMLFDLVADPDESRDLAAEHPIAVRYLRGMLGLALSGAEHRERRRPAIRQESLVIDDATRQMLEELGYAGASRPGHGE